MPEVAGTFKALGDPIRLEMVNRLANGSSHTVGTVLAGSGISRQGARKHLAVLVSAGIVSIEPRGRSAEVVLDISCLDAARAFIADTERRWDRCLGALKEFVEENSL